MRWLETNALANKFLYIRFATMCFSQHGWHTLLGLITQSQCYLKYIDKKLLCLKVQGKKSIAYIKTIVLRPPLWCLVHRFCAQCFRTAAQYLLTFCFYTGSVQQQTQLTSNEGVMSNM